MPTTATLALTDHDLASALAAVDSLDALTLSADADFAVWCDERSDDARDHHAATVGAEVAL